MELWIINALCSIANSLGEWIWAFSHLTIVYIGFEVAKKIKTRVFNVVSFQGLSDLDCVVGLQCDLFQQQSIVHTKVGTNSLGSLP